MAVDTDRESIAAGPATQSLLPADASIALSDFSVGALLRSVAAEFPDREFLVDGIADRADRRRMTYGEVLHEAERVARLLRARYTRDEHVAICAANSLEWILVQLAAALADVVLVMINPALREDELLYQLRQSRSVALFLNRRYRDNQMLEMARAVQASLPGLRDIFLVEGLADLDAPEDIELPAVRGERPTMIQYTSGTTGSPKGAMLSHAGVVNIAKLNEASLALPRHSVWVMSVPLFHTGGSVYHLLSTLWNGGVLVVMRQFDPALLLDLVEQEAANFFSAVPTAHLRIVESPDFRTDRVKTLDCIGCGGSTVPEELVGRLERLYGARYVMTFGQTETSSVISQSRPDDTLEQKATTLGHPLPNFAVKIIDPANGEIVGRGSPGEICVRGCGTMIGYYDMPEKTAETIDAEGWIHTGDLGAIRPDGYLQITGRLKDMIIRGGENISPREIEDVLAAHDAVAKAAVIGIPDREWGEQIAAVVVLLPDMACAAEELADHVRSRIARHKVPRRWRFVEELPLTPSGKVQKFKLKTLFQ